MSRECLGKEKIIHSFDGTRLYTHCYVPINHTANLLVVHGVGEHSGRYKSLLKPMMDAGIALYFYDLRGHGRSEGQRGHIDNWSDYEQDLLGQIDSMPKTDIPTFLMGHSFGSLIVLDFLEKQPANLRGAIISSSALKPLDVATTWQKRLVGIIASIYPPFPLSLKIDKRGISRRIDEVSAYQNDPLIHHKVSAKWGVDVLAAMQRIESNVEKIRLPILMTHGEPDWLNCSQGSKDFFERLRVEDKELIIYPDSYHEPHNDLDSDKVINGLIAWIRQRV